MESAESLARADLSRIGLTRGRAAAISTLAEIAEAWRPWRAYAAMALWMS